MTRIPSSDAPPNGNALLQSWATAFEMPPFSAIAPEHFRPAFEEALARHGAEIAAIAGASDAPSFENTIAALERSGALLRRVSAVFFNLAGAHTNEAIQAIEREIAPVLAKHRDAIFMDGTLFARVAALFEARNGLALTGEQHRVLERTHLAFTRAGAALEGPEQARLSAINARLASLGTQFGQNVLADERSFALALEGERDLAGLPESVRAAAADAARERGADAGHVITLSRSLIESFLRFSDRRDLREKAYQAWISRGESEGANDNRPLVAEIAGLRAQKARLLGYPSFAHYKLDDTMAKSPEAVRALLEEVWAPARARAEEERAALAALAESEGLNDRLAPWDWRYYAEKLRKARYDLDEGEMKPYLPLDGMIAAAFDVARRLFGLSFTERADLPTYHPDVRAWEVRDETGAHLGVFLGDYFARPSKRSGAWMSVYRSQHRLDGEVRPIVVNVANFAKGGEGPTLLSFDDARTLFHEFGHGLHGLLSDVTYPSIAGTGVLRDFVEFPSQLYEHWLEEPEVLRRFARHAETGAPMPEALMDRMLAARNAGQGFATVEYLASALLDLDLHLRQPDEEIDAGAFERSALQAIGMPEEIAMRHRLTHFLHIFSGDGYSAGYYSYLWSEVLDADGFAAFREAGDPFDREVAERLRRHVYAAGGARDPAEAYRAFRGRMPSSEPLLAQRGFVPVE